MRKKIIFCLILLFTCLALSGCATLTALQESIFGGKTLFQAIQDFQDDMKLTDLNSIIAENTGLAQKESTYQAGLEAQRMQTAANHDYWYDTKTVVPGIGAIPGVGDFANGVGDAFKGLCGTVHGWFDDEGGTKATRDSRAQTAADKYENERATDEVLKQSRLAAGLEGFQAGGFSFANIPTGFLVIIVIVVLLVILALLRRSKAKSKAIKKGTYDNSAELAKEQTKQMEIQAELQEKQMEMQAKQYEAQAKQAQLVTVNAEKQAASARARCEKWGLNYEELLAQFNGDPIALNEKLVTSRPEDFQ